MEDIKDSIKKNIKICKKEKYQVLKDKVHQGHKVNINMKKRD